LIPASVLPLRATVRNPGAEFDRDWVLAPRVNHSAVARRAAAVTARRSVTGVWRSGWLLRAVTCLDLTTLAGDDTPGRVAQLAAQARQPVPAAVLDALGMGDTDLSVAAVCIYPALIGAATRALAGTGVAICSVAGGFPAGQIPLSLKRAEVEAARAAGAEEIDVVISRGHVLCGDWAALYDEVQACKVAAGDATLKVILATGELATLRQVAQASRTCLLAGADFIKTSTGKEVVNATLPVGLVMLRAIRDYAEHAGIATGFKAAGGLKRAQDVLDWQVLVKEELGDGWLGPGRFRLGASTVLGDIVRQLAIDATQGVAAGHAARPA
jgi:deoxyribose-phosphate aldolase